MSPVESDPSKGLNGAVAAELRAAKARRNASNATIAAKSGIPKVSVNRYMSGKRAITLALLSEIARTLDVDPDDIIAAANKELERSERAGGARPQAPADSITLKSVDRPLSVTDPAEGRSG